MLLPQQRRIRSGEEGGEVGSEHNVAGWRSGGDGGTGDFASMPTMQLDEVHPKGKWQ
jgi:hypothetical protein